MVVVLVVILVRVCIRVGLISRGGVRLMLRRLVIVWWLRVLWRLRSLGMGRWGRARIRLRIRRI